MALDVFIASLDIDVAGLSRYSDTLDPRELARVDRLRREIDKRQYVASHGILRQILGRSLEAPPAAVEFSYGPFGKPYVGEMGPDRIQFNMSDSGGLLLVAVARGVEVGVDIEKRRPMDYLKFADRFFTPAESESLRMLPEAERESAFFRLWTCKEAYVKGWGYGIQRNVGKFEIRLAGDGPQLVRCSFDETAPARWSLVSLSGLDGYEAAVAVESAGITELSVERWPLP